MVSCKWGERCSKLKKRLLKKPKKKPQVIRAPKREQESGLCSQEYQLAKYKELLQVTITPKILLFQWILRN